MTTCRGYKTSLDLSETPAFSVRVCLSLGSLFFNTSNPIIKSSNLKEKDKNPKLIFLQKRREKIQGLVSHFTRFGFADMYLLILWGSLIILFVDCLLPKNITI